MYLKKLELIDAHCHLQDPRIIADHDKIIANAKKAGVKYLICCATNEKDWDDVAKLSVKYNSVIPCFGIHPWFVDNLSLIWKEKLISVLKNETVELKTHSTYGIGEAGLDFAIKNYDGALQEKIFTEQLILAKEMNLPISIHIRKAWDLFIHIIKKIGVLPAKGLIHSYSGSSDMIPLLEKYGFYISFSGSITRPNAKKTIKALKAVSKDRLLIETDSPDILPSTLLGDEKDKINTPENLMVIADIASQIKKIPVEEFVQATYNNTKRLFSL